MKEIKSESELVSLTNKKGIEKVYIAPAGQYGEMLGIYLNHMNIEWDGYIDMRGSGELNGKKINPYEHICESVNAIFLVAIASKSERITDSIKLAGVRDEYIWLVDIVLIELLCMGIPGACKGEFSTLSYGKENPDDIYMLMFRNQVYEGPFCDASVFLRGFDFAEINGYIPVIDRLHFPSFLYQNVEHFGIDNAWDYYFEQPGGTSLYDVLTKKKNVRKYNMYDSANVKQIGGAVQFHSDMTEDELNKWRGITKKYFRLNEKMKKKLGREVGRIFNEDSRSHTLGCSIREGYNIISEKKHANHSAWVQPSLDEFVDVIREKMSEWDCDRVFCVCEYSETVDYLKSRFDDSILFLERERASGEETLKVSRRIGNNINWELDREEITANYIIEIFLLSMCSGIVGGFNSGISMAILLSDCDYDRINIIDNNVFRSGEIFE